MDYMNPFNAEATSVQNTKRQRFLTPCHVGTHVGTHLIALAEYSQMSTHVPGFQLFLGVFCIPL